MRGVGVWVAACAALVAFGCSDDSGAGGRDASAGDAGRDAAANDGGTGDAAADSATPDGGQLSDLIALYHFEDGSGQVVTDSGPYGYDGTLGADDTVETSDPAWTTEGAIGGGLAFTQADSDYVRAELPENDPFASTNQATVELWYRSTATAVGHPFTLSFLVWQIEVDETYVWWGVGDGNDWQYVDPMVSLNDDTWHHIAMTYDGATMRFYVDGTEIASQDVSVMLGNPNELFIGGRPSNTFVDGFIDEVGVWRVARSATEIAADYAAR